MSAIDLSLPAELNHLLQLPLHNADNASKNKSAFQFQCALYRLKKLIQVPFLLTVLV
jgi:hypothetical protein